MATTLAGESVQGRLGSYAFDGLGSDTPWLPFDKLPRLEVTTTDVLFIGLADDSATTDGGAFLAARDDVSGRNRRDFDVGFGDKPLEAMIVEDLPPGDWVLAVQLIRDDGRGESTTYWAVTVAE